MSDEYLPEWKPWKVRSDELEKLQAKDRTALEAFYFENLSVIERFAKRYYYHLTKMRHFYSLEDMLQNTFLFLEKLNFEAPSYFMIKLRDIFSFSCFGTNYDASIRKEYREHFFATETILDAPLKSDYSRSFGDCIPSDSNPYIELLKERELRRQEKLEVDLEPILLRIFTPKQYEKWQLGLNIDNLRRVLRRHSLELLQFLREHGTPEYKLQGQVLTDEEDKAKSAERRALLKWQEEHFDELEPAEQKKVLERQRLRQLRARQKAEKARASI